MSVKETQTNSLQETYETNLETEKHLERVHSRLIGFRANEPVNERKPEVPKSTVNLLSLSNSVSRNRSLAVDIENALDKIIGSTKA